MIVSFGTKDTEKIWSGERVKKIPLEIQKIGRRKLRMLNNSIDMADLRIPPSNHLDKLKGTDFYRSVSTTSGALFFDGITGMQVMLRFWIIISKKN